MLEVTAIREHLDAYKAGLKKRNFANLEVLEEILDIDEQKRKVQFSLDNTLAELNSLSKEIGQLFKSGNTDEANRLKEKTQSLKEVSKAYSEQLQKHTETLESLLYNVPNIPHPKVSAGKNAEDNEEIFCSMTKLTLTENALPHWELAQKYDIIDFELGNKITGAGFPVYKNQGARLQRALINYFLDFNTQAGYTEYQVPLLVNEASGFGTGQLPDKEGQMYHVTEDNLYLIPTAEVPVTNFFRDSIFNETDLPIKCTGYTPCFRREAGSYGAHVRGLNRLHQFDKVEIVRVEKPENSYQALEEMVEHVKNLLESLRLPYRILRLCGGDMGFTSAMTYDFEVYSAAQDKWLEVSSVSNFETFQANRLKLRIKQAKAKNRLAHTLNGSALALPRIVAALLENNQTDAGILIPEKLVPYCGFDIIK